MPQRRVNPADDTVHLNLRISKGQLEALDQRIERFPGMTRSGYMRFLLNKALTSMPGETVEPPQVVPAKRLLIEAEGTHRCRRQTLLDDEFYVKGERWEKWACSCGKELMKRYG